MGIQVADHAYPSKQTTPISAPPKVPKDVTSYLKVLEEIKSDVAHACDQATDTFKGTELIQVKQAALMLPPRPRKRVRLCIVHGAMNLIYGNLFWRLV